MSHSAPENNSHAVGGRFSDSPLAQAWLVLLLALVFGAALAGVQVGLSDVIAANKLQETLERVPALVPGTDAEGKSAQPGPVEITPGTLDLDNDGKKLRYNLFLVNRDGKPAGWVAKAAGQGYADRIELLVGLDASLSTITGLFILDQKETPGLGNKVTLETWRNQFKGKTTDKPLVVTKGGDKSAHSVDAVTGATISSRSVSDIVNRAVGDLKGHLDENSFKAAERIAK